MGKHVDRQLGNKETAKTTKPVNFKLENNKAFKELVEKVGVLELAIEDLAKKILEAKEEVKTEE